MDIPNGALVVVADGQKYLLLRNHGDRELIDLRVEQHVEQHNPPTHDQGTDRPGRLDAGGPGRSAVQDTDWHEIAKQRFAKDLADRLRTWALSKRFEHLAIVADPSTLGELRHHLHDAVQHSLIGTLDKDLTKHPVDAIEKALIAA